MDNKKRTFWVLTFFVLFGSSLAFAERSVSFTAFSGGSTGASQTNLVIYNPGKLKTSDQPVKVEAILYNYEQDLSVPLTIVKCHNDSSGTSICPSLDVNGFYPIAPQGSITFLGTIPMTATSGTNSYVEGKIRVNTDTGVIVASGYMTVAWPDGTSTVDRSLPLNINGGRPF